MKLKSLFICCLLISSVIANGQNKKEEVFKELKGHWEGAFVKNNSYQKIEIQFFKAGESILSLQRMTEWFPQFGEFQIPVEIDSLGSIAFNTGYGKALMKLDQRNFELVGYIDKSVPTMNVHFKKVADPPPPLFEAKEVSFKNGELEFKGHLHQPKYSPSKTALILIGGRGCYAGDTKYNLFAQSLRPYGISVLVFNKRGTGGSSGDCSKATVSDFASDVKAAKEFLKTQSDFENIGVLGSSAGGWVASRTSEMTELDFIINIVGPSTSVKVQQEQSTSYGSDFYNFSEATKANALKYTNMLFETKANTKGFKEFEMMLKKAKKEGWINLLDNTDIPKTAEDISSLWVRRHSYDPKNALESFDKPYLAIYGETDWIVPYKENIEQLKKYFSGDRSELLTSIIARNAEHGTETPGEYVNLSTGESYWHFYRISPQVLIEIVDFMKKHKFL